MALSYLSGSTDSIQSSAFSLPLSISPSFLDSREDSTRTKLEREKREREMVEQANKIFHEYSTFETLSWHPSWPSVFMRSYVASIRHFPNDPRHFDNGQTTEIFPKSPSFSSLSPPAFLDHLSLSPLPKMVRRRLQFTRPLYFCVFFLCQSPMRKTPILFDHL